MASSLHIDVVREAITAKVTVKTLLYTRSTLSQIAQTLKTLKFVIFIEIYL